MRMPHLVKIAVKNTTYRKKKYPKPCDKQKWNIILMPMVNDRPPCHEYAFVQMPYYIQLM